MKNGLIDLGGQLKAIAHAKLAREMLCKDFERSYLAYRRAENILITRPNDKLILREFLQSRQEFFAIRAFL